MLSNYKLLKKGYASQNFCNFNKILRVQCTENFTVCILPSVI